MCASPGIILGSVREMKNAVCLDDVCDKTKHDILLYNVQQYVRYVGHVIDHTATALP